jgi:tRNA-splicing ligase RtcB (3'-phosphate/5'-hydroxy nucleic acid ligase)
MIITGTDLIQRGWRPGPELGQALKRANQVLATGGTLEVALDAAGSPPKPAEIIGLLREPVCLNEAFGSSDNTEEEENQRAVREHMSRLLRVPVVVGAAVMPDACPAGAEPITVGGAIAVHKAIIPAAHSADVCCSMCASFFPAFRTHDQQMQTLLDVTHFGPGGRAQGSWIHHAIVDQRNDRNPFLQGLDNHCRSQMGTQGDGNHFAYLGQIRVSDELKRNLTNAGHGYLFDLLSRHSEGVPFLNVLVTHHGSRGFGAQVYKRGKEVAERFASKLCPETPKGTEWIPSDTVEGRDYWEALCYIHDWTKANHETIHQRFLDQLMVGAAGRLFNAHNFVWRRGDVFLHGKGATPAWKDPQGRQSLGLIPLNMAAPILLVAGNDNGKFLSFAPHGAGRNRSRTQTINRYSSRAEMEQVVADTTKGIDVRWFSGKLDFAETPVGYKNAAKVTAEIQEFNLATVLGEIKPLGCIMAGEQPEPFWKQQKRERERKKTAL